ncbi:MAG: hypothetical protein M3414_00090 [Pseudomonadota bacterium]|nr:hypothetical protein [Pseudomonadota bacterium]
MKQLNSHVPRNQRGASTLLIAMLLLAILTVASIFATAYGVHEQRTSANEYRYKLVFQAAEAGLNQSIEYLKINTRTMLSTASGGWLFAGAPRWQPCTNAAPAGMAIDPCLAEPDTTRRAAMYRYVGSTSGVLPLSDSLPGAANQTFTFTGGAAAAGGAEFATTYNTYATLCRLDISTATPRCSLAPSTEGTFYVTVVSTGALTNEQSSASVKQSFGTFRLLGATPASPLITAGTAIGLGNAQIIPNPDAGGFGIPVSIWAFGDANVDGASFATCQLGEWMANHGVKAPSETDVLNGVCADCTCNGLCPGYGLLSGDAKSCAAAKDKIEGEDILDVDSNFSDASPKLRDSKYFPPDLFEYVFNVPWSSANSYLTTNAVVVTDCATLNAASAGLIWYKGPGECKLGAKVGSLQEPVVLVSDTTVTMTANGQFFGVVFVTKNAPADGLKATGGGQIYGSVILEGDAKMGGNPTIVYNKAVLRNIGNSNNFLRYGPIPGSWSDTVVN